MLICGKISTIVDGITTEKTSRRDRAAILADINAIRDTAPGTLCEFRHRRKDGTEAVYHHVQVWEDGRNKTVHVPAGKVEAVRAAIEGRRRMEALVAELAAADMAAALCGSTEDPVKKKRPR